MNRDRWDRLATLTALHRVELQEAWAELVKALTVATAAFDDVPTATLKLHIDKLQKDATAALGRGDKRHYRQAMRDLSMARRQLERGADT